VNGTNWTPALVILGVALASGIGLALASRRGGSLPAAEASRRSELLRERDSRYALLREHHAARATASDHAAWRAELDRLEREAALVLQALDALEAPAAPAPVAPRRSAFRGLAWGLGSALVLGALGWWVQESATVRGEGMSVTGGTATELDRALAALEAAVEAQPDDIVARNRLGHAYLSMERPMDAFRQAEAVVAKAPEDPEARTHQAVVLLTMGDAATAGRVLDKVLTGTPGFAEALGWRGAIHFQLGEHAQAAERWSAAVAADASLAPTLEPLIARAKAAPTAPPGAQAAAEAPAQATQPGVDGTIRAESPLPQGATIFLFARPEGVDGGPPTWVRRLPAETLPLDFHIGPEHAMMGGAAPAKLVVTARVDADGNPSTRGAGDLEGASAVVSPGTTGVTLTLAPLP
jgi:tetratricopeptide (TPR) repeat protein